MCQTYLIVSHTALQAAGLASGPSRRLGEPVQMRTARHEDVTRHARNCRNPALSRYTACGTLVE